MIYTGSYKNCYVKNFCVTTSISEDKGKSTGYFEGNSYSKLAPKKEFWQKWHDNIGKITEEENTRYYIEEYYKQVLSKLNPEEVYSNLNYGESIPNILLCYEDSDQFCHRHIVAAWLEITLEIEVPEVIVKFPECLIIQEKRDNKYKEILLDVMKKYQNEHGRILKLKYTI